MNIKEIENRLQEVNANASYNGFTEAVKKAVEDTIISMFPGYFSNGEDVDVIASFQKLFSYVIEDKQLAAKKIEELRSKYDHIHQLVLSDIEAAYYGDPAAKSIDEIILCYPAFRAISAYRVAHELYVMSIPILPRAISEYEHRLTGIDIHPGATIGKNFFIDHGTGVVIGETSVIGNNVKLYQNVTLGAKSFPVEDDGSVVKGIKRHPNLEDNVVVYAGATILGDITIGHDCVIGGNVWLTHSVEPGKTISK